MKTLSVILLLSFASAVYGESPETETTIKLSALTVHKITGDTSRGSMVMKLSVAMKHRDRIIPHLSNSLSDRLIYVMLTPEPTRYSGSMAE